MNQMLLAFCLVLGAGSYWLYTENETLKANNVKLEGAIASQEEAIATMQADFSLQSEQLQSMTLNSQAIQRELMRYSNFIKEYKLTAKILENPVEMERKINNGTKHAFEDIQKISVMPREISLTNPSWIIVTPDNWEAQLARIEEQEGELVFLAMTVPDYEVMAMNMKELQRYITELKDVVVYYRKVTTPNVDPK